jgi:hypothetical protein
MDVRILDNGIEFTNVLGRKRMYGWHELRPYKLGEAIGGGEDYTFGVSLIYGVVVKRVPETEEAIEHAIRRVPKAKEPVPQGGMAQSATGKNDKVGTARQPFFFRPSDVYPSKARTMVTEEEARPTGWWAVPRGPEEWGRLLYEPQWARSRRFKHVERVVGWVLLAATGVAFFVAPLAVIAVLMARGSSLDLLVLAMFPASAFVGGVMLIYVGFDKLKVEARIMPFRVYEKGITKIFVPSYKEGLERRESLIPFDRIRSVEVSRYYHVSYLDDMKMEIRHVDDEGEEHTMTLMAEDVDEPLAVMTALRDHVPEALGEGLDPYMGPGGERNVVAHKNAYAPVDSSGVLSSTVAGLVVFCGLVMAIALAYTEYEYAAYFAGCYGAYAILWVWLRLPVGKQTYLLRVKGKAVLTEEGIELPFGPSVATFLRRRRLVRFHEITEVRRVLDPRYYSHMAQVRTVSGERIMARNDVFETLCEHPDFDDQGFVLFNQRIAPMGSGTPLVQASAPKVVLFLLVVPLPWIVLAFRASTAQNELRTIFREWLPYYLLVLVMATMLSYLTERLFMPAVSRE